MSPQAVVEDYPSFVRHKAYGDDSEFRLVLRHNYDERREFTVTVMVSNVPT